MDIKVYIYIFIYRIYIFMFKVDFQLPGTKKKKKKIAGWLSKMVATVTLQHVWCMGTFWSLLQITLNHVSNY